MYRNLVFEPRLCALLRVLEDRTVLEDQYRFISSQLVGSFVVFSATWPLVESNWGLVATGLRNAGLELILTTVATGRSSKGLFTRDTIGAR